MALTRTTLSAACGAVDTEVTIASITGLQAGYNLLIDGESMRVTTVGSAATVPVGVYRGIRGSNVVAHPTTAGVTFGPAGDFGGANVPSRSAARLRDVVSLSAAGAITLNTPGRDLVAIINGTSVVAATLANPAKDNDGDVMYIVGNGKAAHTVTYTAGLGAGGAALDVLTFAAGGQQCLLLVAANETWVPVPSVLAGTLTNITVTAS